MNTLIVLFLGTTIAAAVIVVRKHITKKKLSKKTINDVLETLNQEQKDAVYAMIAMAIDETSKKAVERKNMLLEVSLKSIKASYEGSKLVMGWAEDGKISSEMMAEYSKTVDPGFSEEELQKLEDDEDELNERGDI